MDRAINLLIPALMETIYMVFFSSIFATLLGMPIGILAVVTSKGNIAPMPILNRILDIIINIFRSFPFIILMILVFPLSRVIVGTTIGSKATIVPLSIAAAPFVARIIEGAIKEVDNGLIEASESMGANVWQIIFKVLIPEAMPSLVHGGTIVIISLLGYSAMAGAIGGGGLGDLALRYGYQRFQTDIMIVSVITIIILVQLIQVIGDFIIKIIKRNRK